MPARWNIPAAPARSPSSGTPSRRNSHLKAGRCPDAAVSINGRLIEVAVSRIEDAAVTKAGLIHLTRLMKGKGSD